jgi:DNA-binding MarR family transcriptional regulator
MTAARHPARSAAPLPAKAAGPSSPSGCTNLRLHRLGRRVARLYDEDVRALGLKGTQYSLLSFIVALGPIQPSVLAAKLDLGPSTLTRNLQPLIAQGWVRLEAGENQRSRRVVATDAGRTLRAEAQRAWKRSQLALNAKLSPPRVARLHALIDECMELLDDADLPQGEADE